jgi:hypothetical protein
MSRRLVDVPIHLYDTAWLNWRLLCLPLDLLQDTLPLSASFFLRTFLGVH